MCAIKNPVLDTIFGDDNSEKSLTLKEQINQAIENHLGNTKDPIYKRSINLQYWNLVGYIMKRKIQTQKLLPGDFVLFTRSEQLAIDYGYISDRLTAEIKDFNTDAFFDDALVSTIAIEPALKYYSVTSWLNEQLKEFMGFYDIERYRQQHEKAVSDISLSKSEFETMVKAKKGLVKSIALGFTDKNVFARIEALTDKIDGVANKYAFIRYKIQSGTAALSKEERLELIGIENTIKVASNERKTLLNDINNHMNLTNIEEEVLKKECELLGLIAQAGKAKTDLESVINAKNSITAAQKEEMFNERVSLLKNILELVAKRSKVEPTPFLAEKLAEKIPDKVFQALATFIESDPQVFRNKKMKRFGYPNIIFVPGCGNGVYNYDLNSLVLPLFPLKDFRELLISAMVLYRWDCDEDREFRDSFSSLKPFKRLSFVDLQRALIQSYILYITKERQGYKVFDKEIRDWFNYNVAPKKDETKKIEIQQVDPEQREKAPETLPERSYEEANYFDQPGARPDYSAEQPEPAVASAPPEGRPQQDQPAPAQVVAPAEIPRQEPAPVYAPAGPAAPPVERQQEIAEVPVTEEFEKARRNIYEKLKSILKADGIEGRFAINPSQKSGKVDIHLLGVDVYSTELDLIFNTLLIQSKLHKFTDLFKKE